MSENGVKEGVETVNETGFECRITLVNPGHSDSVLKVFPAEHKEEKIWLDKQPGKERWEMVQRMMQLHASRFSPIANPVPYCNDNRKLDRITLKESDIPTVKLENFVLTAPPKIKVATPAPTPETSGKEWSERIDKLENTVNKLAEIMTDKFSAPTTQPITGRPTDTTEPTKRGPGRPKKA